MYDNKHFVLQYHYCTSAGSHTQGTKPRRCIIPNILRILFGGKMDRRQIKSRRAIKHAFCALLKQKDYTHITVQEIIDAADVGRTTFYAHFETKEFLLQAICEDLFDHVASYDPHGNLNPQTVFLHLFSHLKRNDSNLLDLLSSPNNALFVNYFKISLKQLVQNLFLPGSKDIPDELWANHIAAAFVETIGYWIHTDLSDSEEKITRHLLSLTGHLLIQK